MRVLEYLSIPSGSQKEEENMLVEKGDSLNVISKETENILVFQMIEWKNTQEGDGEYTHGRRQERGITQNGEGECTHGRS